MKLKKNIIATYLGQFYVALVGILMVPTYIRLMGVEAYGLVGFFSMLQVWFSLLDFGLTPTVARETARYRGGAISAIEYRQLVRALELVFVFVAIVGCVVIFISAEFIATDWLKSSILAKPEVMRSVQLMAFAISMRWMCGLYRGTISGSERLVFLSGYSSFVASMRFIGVVPILVYVDAKPTTFFAFQLSVGTIELLGLVLFSTRLLPRVASSSHRGVIASVRPILRFSATIAFTTAVWAVITQTDKLVLSRILPLGEYAYFTLAVMVASGVLMLGGPVSAAILPRLARLEAQGDHKSLIAVYRQATQFVAIVAGSAAVTIAFCAEPLLAAWTGDQGLARAAAPILVLYAVGNGVMTVSAFPYYLQYAKGDLRLHLIGNAVFVVMLIPTVVLVSEKFGGIGAGWVWLLLNAILFVAWLPMVHRKFEPGLNRLWYSKDTTAIFIAIGLSGWGLSKVIPRAPTRVGEVGYVALFGAVVLLAGGAASSKARAVAANFLHELGNRQKKDQGDSHRTA